MNPLEELLSEIDSYDVTPPNNSPFKISVKEIYESIYCDQSNDFEWLKKLNEKSENSINFIFTAEVLRLTALIGVVIFDFESKTKKPFNDKGLSELEYSYCIASWLKLLLDKTALELLYLPSRSRDKKTHGDRPINILEKEVADLFFKTEGDYSVREFFKKPDRRNFLNLGYLFFVRQYDFFRARKLKEEMLSLQGKGKEEPVAPQKTDFFISAVQFFKGIVKENRLGAWAFDAVQFFKGVIKENRPGAWAFIDVVSVFFARLCASILVGGIFVMFNNVGWDLWFFLQNKVGLAYQSGITAILLVTNFLYFGYKVRKKVEGMYQIVKRASIFLWTFLFSFGLFRLLFPVMEALKNDPYKNSITITGWSNFFASINICLFFMLLGILLQVIWEDKSLTEPV